MFVLFIVCLFVLKVRTNQSITAVDVQPVAFRSPVKKRRCTDKEQDARVRTCSSSSSSSSGADDLDTGLSLVDDEALALKLLTS